MMNITPWFILFSFLCGAASALIGVALGAFAVYRTKRDSYEPFFTTGRNTGEAFNIGDDFEQAPVTKTELPEETQAANDAFVKQFAENLAAKAGK